MMNMTSISAPNPEQLVSLEQLKNNARTTEDVEYWVQENLSYFAIARPTSNESVWVSFSFQCLDSLYGLNWTEKVCPGSLTIRVEYQAEDEPDMSAFAAATHSETIFKKEIDLHLPYAEWPLLTAGVALGCLQNQFYVEKEDLDALHDILVQFIPLHFPGMTWAALQGLHASDLLPVDSLNYLDTPAVLEMLFAARSGKDVTALPESMTL